MLVAFPQIAPLNVMGLGTPQSAVLGVIFNAVIIILLIPLALRGVKFRPMPAAAILRRNLLIYGLGGIIVPFPGIWLIDLLVHDLLHLASTEERGREGATETQRHRGGLLLLTPDCNDRTVIPSTPYRVSPRG